MIITCSEKVLQDGRMQSMVIDTESISSYILDRRVRTQSPMHTLLMLIGSTQPFVKPNDGQSQPSAQHATLGKALLCKHLHHPWRARA
jgi:hypothetical protein